MGQRIVYDKPWSREFFRRRRYDFCDVLEVYSFSDDKYPDMDRVKCRDKDGNIFFAKPAMGHICEVRMLKYDHTSKEYGAYPKEFEELFMNGADVDTYVF